MSGFEVVGVVLGVLPLIITAIEDYEKIIGPIVTFRQYSKALKTFTTELNVQRDIFQNECIWILSRFVDGHQLEDMLKDSSHDLRNEIKGDNRLDRAVSNTIGPHYGQLRDILQLIENSLNEIFDETKDLHEGLTRPSRAGEEPVDMKAWKSHMKQKLKLSLKKDSLNDKINDLRHRNQAFLAISQQIVRFNASWTPAQTPREEQSVDKCLEKIQKLRGASKTLHHHLAKLWSCPTHTGHSANLRLCLETSELYPDAPPKMLFDMALTYSDMDQPTPHRPILLAVESIVKATGVAAKPGKTTIRFSEPQEDENFKPASIQRQASAGLVKKEKAKAGRTSGFRGLLKKIKGDRTDTPQISGANYSTVQQSTVPHNDELPVRVLAQKPVEPPIPDLNSFPNPCLHILETSQGDATGDNACIGYLAGLGTDRYLVYTRQAAPSSGTTTISLSKMIANHRQEQYLPRPEKWRLAGALSLAVLLYHSTPWLQKELKSSDILFFGSDDPRRPGTLKEPHLSSFRQSKVKIQKSAHTFNEGLMKNEMLYYLGIVLLELEFEDSFESLISGSKVGLPGDVPSVQSLILLKRRAGSQLGTMYGRIIRMCLDCDFGLGLDEYTLEDPRVQKVFYSQVVKQFQERMPEYNKIWGDD